MFDEENKNAGVEDILASTEAEAPLGPPTALAQGKLQPVKIGALNPVVPVEQLSRASGGGFPIKKILAFVVVLAVVAGGATAGYFWWPGRSQTTAPGAAPLGQPNPEQPLAAPPGADNGEGNNGLNQAVNELRQNAINQVVDPFAKPEGAGGGAPGAGPVADTDQDGLSDAEEATVGTNPRLVDSDGDGLSDWEEVTVFGTNALNSDSDGDTYSDGSEVQNGYNPNGPGKLLDFEKAKKQAQ